MYDWDDPEDVKRIMPLVCIMFVADVLVAAALIWLCVR